MSKVSDRVAKWQAFKPKNPIFEGLGMDDFGLLYGHLVYFVTIWYIVWLFGTFYPFFVRCTKTNLATLASDGSENNLCVNSIFGIHRIRQLLGTPDRH
jgi:hypothetical protein